VEVSCIDMYVNDFRRTAFKPEQPLLMRRQQQDQPVNPAMRKWFAERPTMERAGFRVYRPQYLHRHSDVELPYEFLLPADTTMKTTKPEHRELLREILNHLGGSPKPGFHRFTAPLGLLLKAHDQNWPHPLYIAQAQIAELPGQLQDDLKPPTIVKYAGKGDIYDANIVSDLSLCSPF
jgi:hypothetical protein